MTDKTRLSASKAIYNMLDAGLRVATIERALKELNTPVYAEDVNEFITKNKEKDHADTIRDLRKLL